MTRGRLTVLCVGATGSVGRHVVEEALRRGHAVRALVRSRGKAAGLPAQAEIVVGELTQPDTLAQAVAGVDAIVFTHGSNGGKADTRAIDYGGVRNVLFALGGRKLRIALMTAIGVTDRAGSYNRKTEAHDWKRRSERLLRASGNVYTIVRPGWFDYNDVDQHRLVLLQGDTRHAGTPADGVIARRQIAEVLVASLTLEEASNKTFELVAEAGPEQQNLAPLFAAVKADDAGAPDGVGDAANMPLDQEPQEIRDDLRQLENRQAPTSDTH
ncbi:epimerase [Rhodanobacter sp. C06]|uniref:SDR family oxidoreductase n=1 Tax=Rhodanobacter sp. C06 TaxID=1945854 RepID=UPI00098499BB|nr:SDR family oxidoreductase [Rhodanobacter sp. C06]OOG46325.1 epimerase [Rhodanobacter sp. C06]HXE78287.1 SDR family oxidoreductase [Rhodanobacter sp.]